jgi:hypothetical protein
MINDKAFAERQIKRLSQMQRFPKEREAQRELCFALMAFPTQESAEAWISDYLASETETPFPRTIRLAAQDVEQRDNLTWLEKKQCPDCYGSGFRLKRRVMRAVPGMTLSGYDFAVPCNHMGGKNVLA